MALEKFPRLDASGDVLEANVVIRLGDNITTDHIMPAGAEILALRSNIPAISEHVFVRVDPDFVKRARAVSEAGGNGVIVAGAANTRRWPRAISASEPSSPCRWPASTAPIS